MPFCAFDVAFPKNIKCILVFCIHICCLHYTRLFFFLLFQICFILRFLSAQDRGGFRQIYDITLQSVTLTLRFQIIIALASLFFQFVIIYFFYVMCKLYFLPYLLKGIIYYKNCSILNVNHLKTYIFFLNKSKKRNELQIRESFFFLEDGRGG